MNASIDFDDLFTETQAMIYNLGMRLFRRNEDDAMDFAQDVYLQAYKKLSSFQGKSKPSTWLYSLALNLGLNKIKKEKRIELVDNSNSELESIYAIESEQPDKLIVDILNRRDISKKIENALWQLPENHRLPLVLYFFEQMSYQEISKSLGMPEGTIKSSVYRGKIQLRNHLKNEVIL